MPHEKLKEFRQAAGLTQACVARLLGVSVHWVSKRETGETSISLEDIARLSIVYSIDEEDILSLVRSAA